MKDARCKKRFQGRFGIPANPLWVTLIAMTLAIDLPTKSKDMVKMECAQSILDCWSNCLMAEEPARKAVASPNTDAIRLQVRSAIDRLNSNQLSQRKQAEKDLLNIGPNALREIPPPELLASPQVRHVMSRIRNQLEQELAESSVRPALVSIAGGLTLRETLEHVAAQSGNQLDSQNLSSDLLTSLNQQNFKNDPFWNVLEKICDIHHLELKFQPDSPKLGLKIRSSPITDWSTAISGAFRVSLNDIERRAIAGQPDAELLQVAVTVAPEPRLRALFLKFAAKDFFAETNSGIRILPMDPDAQYDFPLGEGGRIVPFTIGLKAPAELPDSKLYPLSFHGKALIEIAASEERISFANLEQVNGTARRRGGVTVTVQKLDSTTTPEGELSVNVRTLVAYDSDGPAFESHRTWVLHNQVRMESDQSGSLGANGGFDTEAQGRGRVVVTYRFDLGKSQLKSWRFVYVAPTLLVDVPIEINWKSVSPLKNRGKNIAR